MRTLAAIGRKNREREECLISARLLPDQRPPTGARWVQIIREGDHQTVVFLDEKHETIGKPVVVTRFQEVF